MVQSGMAMTLSAMSDLVVHVFVPPDESCAGPIAGDGPVVERNAQGP